MMNLPPKVKPGQPVRASHHNQILDALGRLDTVRNKYGPFQRSRGVSESSHPFRISLSGGSEGARKVSIKGGIWLGDGASARGVLGIPKSEPLSIPFQPGQDAWKIDDTEFDLTGSGTRHFFIKNKMKNGRILGEWMQVPVTDGSEGSTEMMWLNTMSLDVSGSNGTELEELTKGKNPSQFIIGSVDLTTGEITQIRRDNIYYAPDPHVAAPLVFHPVQDAVDKFECLGGLLRVLPNTVKGGKRAVGHLYDQDNTSISGDFDAEGCVPRRETLQAYTTAIPPHTLKIDRSNSTANGWLVFLRVRMAYRELYPYDTECIVPVPEIEWDCVPIPDGGSTTSDPWDFANTELEGFSAASSEGSHRTFSHIKNGERMPIPNTFVGTWTSSIYDWSFAYTFAVNTEAFESIIPIGIFHCPFVSEGSWSEPTPPIERIIYCPLKTGIIDWTPPAEFDFNGTTFIWND